MTLPDDNKEGTGDNKPQPSTLPSKEQERDPAFSEWSQKHTDMESAYKAYTELEGRYDGSSKEGKRLADERENLQNRISEMEQYKNAFLRVEEIASKDPEILKRIKKHINPDASEEEDEEEDDVDESRLSEKDRKLLEEVRTRQDSEVKNKAMAFRDKHKEVINSDAEWSKILSIAGALDGKTDRNNVQYTVETALRDAMIIVKPEIMSDKEKYEAFAAIERRDSVAESTDIPYGRSETGSDEEKLSPEHEYLAEKMGVSKDRLLKRLKARKTDS